MSMIGNLLAISQTELNELYDKPETITKVLYENYYDQAVNLDKTSDRLTLELNPLLKQQSVGNRHGVIAMTAFFNC